MSSTDNTQNFFLRLNEGHPSAAEELDHRYRERLCILVERELGSRFSARIDVEDPVQSALASFCRGIKERRFHIDNSGGLWRLLEKVTRNKVRKMARHHDTAGRAPGRETEISALGDQCWSREPTPEDAALAADLVEQVLQGLDPPDPEIFRMRLEGHSRSEIANHFGLTDGSVRCRIDRLRERLQRLLGEDGLMWQPSGG
jgi:RNA polymerase sigma-70 factor, ECF subfamily